MGEWLLVLCGILSLLFGVLLVILPVLGALAIIWLIGICAIIFGALLTVLAFWLRSLGHEGSRMKHLIRVRAGAWTDKQ